MDTPSHVNEEEEDIDSRILKIKPAKYVNIWFAFKKIDD
tara:strand:+ start:1557 stop:1673 length:117 start_codon:yes stop_codon:yes gene_type:complete